MRWKYCTPCSILLLFWITCASLCWGQYTTTYQTGVTDLTSYLPTTNVWKLLPGGGVCQPDTLVIFGDGSLYCIGGTYRGAFSYANGVWTRISAMGDNIQQLAGQNSGNIFALLSNSYCTSHNFGYGVYKWNGSAWTQPNSLACVQQLAGAGDGTLVGAIANVGVWESTDGGVTWPQISGGTYGPNLSYVSAASSNLMCGTNGTQVFTSTGNGFVALTAQPASSGIAGCVITDDGDSMFAWGTFGTVKRFDLTGAGTTWNTVYGMTSPHGMTTAAKGATFALSNIGNVPYHLNVYAGFVSGTTTGSLNGCPPPAACSGGVVHTGTLKVTLPHGMFGAQGQQAVSPTTNMNVSSFDADPTCDPLFGDPSDPNCQGLSTGSVICSASGTNFQAGGPPPPPIVGSHFSEWVGSYTGSYVIENQGHIMPNTYVAKIGCAAVGTCRPPTTAICAPPKIQGVADEGGACTGNACTSGDALKAAEAGCKKHSISGGPPGAWGWYSTYDNVNGNITCVSVHGYDAKPYIDPCY